MYIEPYPISQKKLCKLRGLHSKTKVFFFLSVVDVVFKRKRKEGRPASQSDIMEVQTEDCLAHTQVRPGLQCITLSKQRKRSEYTLIPKFIWGGAQNI